MVLDAQWNEIKGYLDAEGRLWEWPSKRNKASLQKIVLEYLASKFENGKDYNELQVNERLNQWHLFGDHALLRRELVIKRLLYRTSDGRRYWKRPG